MCIGCAGDVDPEPLGKPEMIGPHGRAVADEVNRLLAGKLTPLVPTLVARRREIELPMADLPTRQQLEARIAAAPEAEGAVGPEPRCHPSQALAGSPRPRPTAADRY